MLYWQSQLLHQSDAFPASQELLGLDTGSLFRLSRQIECGLNTPKPMVDIIDGKTGMSVWQHGTGSQHVMFVLSSIYANTQH